MFSNAMNAQKAYQSAGLEAKVLGSSPHELIRLLFEGALVYLTQARQHLIARDIPAKSHAFARAIEIVSHGLRSSLDRNAGGDLARSLDELYEYITIQLVKSQMNDDLAKLDEATGLLRELGDAWSQIGEQQKV